MNINLDKFKNYIELHLWNKLINLKALVSLCLLLLKGRKSINLNKSKLIEKLPDFNFFITSNEGLFLCCKNRLTKIFSFYTFGISINNNQIFIASTIFQKSFIIRAEFNIQDDIFYIRQPKVLWHYHFKSHGERMHQLYFYKDKLFVANTRDNSITILCSDSGNILYDLYPFFNKNKNQIVKGHINHINSVFCSGNTILFTAHDDSSKNKSCIGTISEDTVKIYSYKNRGIHDICISNYQLFFSDSFGEVKKNLATSKDEGNGGDLVISNKKILKENNLKNYYFIRGFCSNQNKLIVGSSFHGKRNDRWNGNSELLVFENNIFKNKITLPFSQIYDFLNIDGKKLENQNDNIDISKIDTILEDSLGKPSYIFDINNISFNNNNVKIKDLNINNLK